MIKEQRAVIQMMRMVKFDGPHCVDFANDWLYDNNNYQVVDIKYFPEQATYADPIRRRVSQSETIILVVKSIEED